MAEVGIRELLESGVHFGHQTRRWNPKMRRFIFGERGGIHIIDLELTQELLNKAQEFSANLASRGGVILFVGTKKQARDSIKETADKCGMPYINQRWLGGLLTNFQTINKRIKRLHELTEWTEGGQMELLPMRERIKAISERDKLEVNLGGVRDMQRPPDAMFVVDLNVEEIAVREAARLKIPIIALTDSNCDPDPVSFVIPGNDDAIKACKVVIEALGDVVGERASVYRAEQEAARKEAEEQQRAQAEQQAARKAAEEESRKEAEEASAEMAQKREAEAQQRADAAEKGATEQAAKDAQEAAIAEVANAEGGKPETPEEVQQDIEKKEDKKADVPPAPQAGEEVKQ
ncbi:MAG: 30S ribosomal protein S2 [Thermoleophilaceae bacterium]|nr:30S ribosomal protein S2 [Thermoleophilaceae bacterium]